MSKFMGQYNNMDSLFVLKFRSGEIYPISFDLAETTSRYYSCVLFSCNNILRESRAVGVRKCLVRAGVQKATETPNAKTNTHMRYPSSRIPRSCLLVNEEEGGRRRDVEEGERGDRKREDGGRWTRKRNAVTRQGSEW